VPIYTVTCQEHGQQTVVRQRPEGGDAFPCPQCGRLSARVWEPAGLEPFKSYFTEGLATGTQRIVEVTSREQERALCRALGAERIS
jgi:hypothetical protein